MKNVKEKTPAPKSTKTLSAEQLIVIEDAIRFMDGNLDKLHWQAVAFGATDPLYRNIVNYRHKLEEARHAVCILFEQQFEPKKL
jgi:hypothetical protein